MLNRRALLAATASSAALGLAPARAATAPAPGQVNALLDGFFHEDLQRHPEAATELALDKGADAGLSARLGDVSPAGLAAEQTASRSKLQRLRALDRRSLRGVDAVSYDTIAYVEEANLKTLSFDFGGQDGFSPSPYVLTPITGAYQRVPVFLDTKHRVETAADAEAYLSRLDAFATVLDQNTDRFRHDAAAGITPPDFLLDTTLAQITDLQVAPEQSSLVTSLDRRAKAKGLGDAYGRRAAKLYADKVAPALARQTAAVRTVRATAVHAAGIGRLREGPAYYAANLAFTTTTTLTPDEVHKLGLDQAAEIGARLDVLLKKRGLTRGTVGQRIAALYKDRTLYYPNTPAGKAQLIGELQAKLAVVKQRLPRMFGHVPKYDIEVRAVPPAIDAGSPLAYSESPALDGSRPGYVYFNLHDTAEWPKWNLPSTLYHEALPGHQLQGGFAFEAAGLPMARRVLYFSGYGEGWALYAEQLADELGLYEDDELGRIGWLKAQIFRAGRCVTDTGIHHMGWSREQAVAYLTGLDGDAVGSTTREVDRYCAIPGQACSYKIGHTTWNRLRTKAQAALGPRFDIKAFHDAGLNAGAMPLTVLEGVVDDYIRAANRA